MPNYENYKDWERPGEILGIAIHHSATADRTTGIPVGDAFSFFDYHVNGRGWAHGGYNYVITGNGTIQYALDEKIAAYHAGFKDPTDSLGLEQGQYWNNHYLALCLSGWFSDNRTYNTENGIQTIPNNHTRPNQTQIDALMALIQHLMEKYNIPVENIRAHRELAGNSTQCPGLNMDPAQIRRRLREAQPAPLLLPDPGPGEHVILIPDTGDYLTAALGYIWKFQPDASFAPHTAAGRWEYITAVGEISPDLLAEYRQQGAKLVQHIAGDADTVQQQLDDLVRQNQRFLPLSTEPETEDFTLYTVQPGDSLSKIAQYFYGEAHLWTVIFEANQDVLSDPGLLQIGQTLKIPLKP
jgi:hypothetical protein